MIRPHHPDLSPLRAVIEHAPRQAPSVSRWTVGMQVHHCGLAMIGICRALAESTPPTPSAGFSLAGALVFLTGWIPRGRGQAPPISVPRKSLSPSGLSELLDEAEEGLRQAAELGPDAWFPHPYFGPLRRDKAIRFIGIHNRHHMKIAADILRATENSPS